MPRQKRRRDGRGRPKKDRSYDAHGREKQLKSLMTDPILETIATTTDDNLRRDLVAQLFSKRENGEHVESPLLTLPLPGSPMEYLLAAFQSKSKITLAIPFWQAFLLTAQKLAAAESHVVLPAGSKVCPAMYAIICSNTGECKSWTLKKLRDVWDVETIPNPMSPQAAIKSVQRRDGKACFMPIDEFGSTWKRWLSKEDGMLYRELLLFAHTQERFTGSLKDDEEAYTIDEPIVSLLGMTQIDNFHRYFTPEDWESGFMPRCFVAVGPQRAEWEEGLDLDPIEKALNEGVLPRFEKLFRETPIHSEYKLTASAKALAVWHSKKMTKEMGISMGYARRGLYGLYKFAHVWHLLNGKFSDEIDSEDMELAIRTLEIVWHDLKLLTSGGVSELADVTVKAIKFATDCELGNQTDRNCAEWQKCRRTALVQGVKEIDKFNVRWVLDVVEHNLHNVTDFEEEKPESKDPQSSDPFTTEDLKEEISYWNEAGSVFALEDCWEHQEILDLEKVQEEAFSKFEYPRQYALESIRKSQWRDYADELSGNPSVQARLRANEGEHAMTVPDWQQLESEKLDGHMASDFQAILGWESEADVKRFEHSVEAYERGVTEAAKHMKNYRYKQQRKASGE